MVIHDRHPVHHVSNVVIAAVSTPMPQTPTLNGIVGNASFPIHASEG